MSHDEDHEHEGRDDHRLRRAMYMELEAQHLAYVAEQPVKVVYRGVDIPGQRVHQDDGR